MRAATPELLSVFSRSADPTAMPATMHDFVHNCLSSPSTPRPPYQLRCLLSGMYSLQANEIRGLVLSRQQDLEPVRRLLQSNLPTFHMYGKEDRLVFGNVVEAELKEHSQNLQVLVVPHFGHSLFVEAPELVASNVIQFVKKISPSSSVNEPSFL
jgi:pimeloyl-ACP methyl ester carboxylesterase